jgi:hypothetical protein
VILLLEIYDSARVENAQAQRIYLFNLYFAELGVKWAVRDDERKKMPLEG